MATALHTTPTRTLAVLACVLFACQPGDAYQISQRWTITASGAAGPFGSPVTLTWSFMPDGTAINKYGSSDLVSFLD